MVSCSPQRLRIESIRLLHRSSDVTNTDIREPIKSIRPTFLDFGNLMICYPDGRAEKVSKKSIWGYADKRGQVYRYYRNAYYEIVSIGDMVKYERERTRAARFTETSYNKTLDSKIFRNRTKALRDLATL